ncbi:MAG: hypothetical protein ACI9KE_000532 [Polyangiales bacterium]
MKNSVFWLVLLCGACSCEDTPPPPAIPLDGGPPSMDGGADTFVPRVDIPNPVFVQTASSEEVRAGELIMVTCTILDQDGETYSAVGRTPRIRFSPSDSVAIDGENYVAIVAGEVEVSCSFPDLMLTDDQPAITRIVPGPAVETTTTLDGVSITAGETVTAECITFDAYGNRIDDADPGLRIEPSDPGNTVDGLSAEMTRAGIYEASCELEGAASQAAPLEVVPALPANLIAGRVPEQAVYGIGQVVEVSTVVTDRYGNEVSDAPMNFTSVPVGSQLGRNRFRYLADGVYDVTARVTGATEGGALLEATVQFIVNGDGPTIVCDGPGDGTMIDLPGSGRVTFSGTVGDVSGIETVRVNGMVADVDAGGGFTATVDATFGINFVEIIARDAFGEESSRTCSFLASSRWGVPTSTFEDTVSLELRQAAIDDMSASGPIDSLDDILDRVVNSSGLRDTLHTSLLAANPLKPSSCDLRVFVCVFRSQVDYRDIVFNGARITDLTLRDGGVRAHVRLEDVQVQLEISGTLDTTGWADFEYIDITMDLNTSISAGRPRLTVVPGSVNTTVGDINPRFSGFSGTIVNIVVNLINGRLRDLVEDQLESYVTSSFNDVLDGVLGGLDIESLGSTFNVPRLDGSGSIPLGFGVAFNSLTTNTSRMRFGIGTRFSGPTTIARPTRGVAVPGTSGGFIDSPIGTNSMTVSVHNVIFNQVLHQLWRGGLLEANIDGATLGGSLPDGLTAEISGALPPVVVMHEGGVDLGIGALTIRLVYPGLFDEPITMVLGANSSTSVSLVGNDLQFGAITVEELHFSTEDASLDAGTRATLSRFLTTLVQSIVDSALNDALPAIPIPSFDLPSSLTTYGIPAGTTLGLRSPALARENPHFVLRGMFGSL